MRASSPHIHRFALFASGALIGLFLMAAAASATPGNGNGSSNANHNANGKGLSSTAPGNSDHTAANPENTVPQPASNADFTGNGANTSGAYDSTRNGSPSLNGNGGGQAVGKPCAGCVGKADNKNPKGQAPNGSDNNAGYECDTNHGIGQTNPAHTGCQPSTPVIPPPVITPGGTPPVVLGEQVSRPSAEVLGLQLSRVSGLAFTGFNVQGLFVLALLSLLVGTVLMRFARRPSPVAGAVL